MRNVASITLALALASCVLAPQESLRIEHLITETPDATLVDFVPSVEPQTSIHWELTTPHTITQGTDTKISAHRVILLQPATIRFRAWTEENEKTLEVRIDMQGE